MIWVERLLSSTLAFFLLTSLFIQRYVRTAIIGSAIILAAMIVLDQMRLQPWVYQYLLLLALFSLGSGPMLRWIQLVIAGLYFWSGIQKLNFSFVYETLPTLVSPFQFQNGSRLLLAVGLGIALFEVAIGIGLMIGKTRKAAVIGAILLHASILIVLIARAENSVVWVWNAVLAALVIKAFWTDDDSIKGTPERSLNLRTGSAAAIALAAVLLPALSFFGLWDMFLSGALYSGNKPVAVIRVDEHSFKRLPEAARKTVFEVKGGNEKMLPLFEWSMAELNVPVVPEQRVFEAVARKVCLLSDKSELIIKERPAILDGKFNVRRLKCGDL